MDEELEVCVAPEVSETPEAPAEETAPQGEACGPESIYPETSVDEDVATAQADVYAGQYDDCEPVGPMPADKTDPDAAKANLDELSGMSNQDKAVKLAGMSDAQVKAMVESLPPEELSKLAELSESANTPAAKYMMWKAGHRARAQEDVNDIDPDMDPAQAEEIRKRRQATADGTMKEMDAEEALLEKKLEDGSLSAAEVDELVTRKNLERDIEKTYNINLTATDGLRKNDGAMKGTRVIWSTDELKAVAATLSQVPEREVDFLKNLNRSEEVINGGKDVNAENDFAGNINIGDQAASFDASGKLGVGKFGGKRDKANNPDIAAMSGDKTTFLEWTLTHELGHTGHHLNQEAFAKYKEDMGVKDISAGEAMGTLGFSDFASMAAGVKIEKDGVIYVKEGNSVRTYPKGIDGWSTASDGTPQPGEYFSEHYNQAILAPEETAKEYLDAPKEKSKLAFDEQQAAAAARNAERDAGGVSPETQHRLDQANAAFDLAAREQKTWEKAYGTMRNDVFGAGDVQKEADERLVDAGMDENTMKEFRERAARLSTPDQIDRLEQELTNRTTVPAP